MKFIKEKRFTCLTGAEWVTGTGFGLAVRGLGGFIPGLSVIGISIPGVDNNLLASLKGIEEEVLEIMNNLSRIKLIGEPNWQLFKIRLTLNLDSPKCKDKLPSPIILGESTLQITLPEGIGIPISCKGMTLMNIFPEYFYLYRNFKIDLLVSCGNGHIPAHSMLITNFPKGFTPVDGHFSILTLISTGDIDEEAEEVDTSSVGSIELFENEKLGRKGVGIFNITTSNLWSPESILDYGLGVAGNTISCFKINKRIIQHDLVLKRYKSAIFYEDVPNLDSPSIKSLELSRFITDILILSEIKTIDDLCAYSYKDLLAFLAKFLTEKDRECGLVESKYADEIVEKLYQKSGKVLRLTSIL